MHLVCVIQYPLQAQEMDHAESGVQSSHISTEDMLKHVSLVCGIIRS